MPFNSISILTCWHCYEYECYFYLPGNFKPMSSILVLGKKRGLLLIFHSVLPNTVAYHCRRFGTVLADSRGDFGVAQCTVQPSQLHRIYKKKYDYLQSLTVDLVAIFFQNDGTRASFTL